MWVVKLITANYRVTCSLYLGILKPPRFFLDVCYFTRLFGGIFTIIFGKKNK